MIDIFLYFHFELDINCVTKLFRLVYCRWRWQALSPDPFTYVCRPDIAKRIAGIRSENILFLDHIQPQANRENYETEIFERTKNEDNTKFKI